MRNLIITRKKSFVGCLAKMKVYIEDQAAGEITINTVPCRKLGTLKNGEQKTFAIEESAAKVYVIADTLSKDYCNEYYELPAGQEDVALTGKNCYNPAAGNPFRFDNNPSAGAVKNRKRGTRVGLIVLLVAAIGSSVIGLGLGLGTAVIENMTKSSKPQSFSAGDMTITLTKAFRETEYEGFAGVYDSRNVAVFALKEPFTLAEGLGNKTRKEYSNLFIQNNGLSVNEIREGDGMVWFKYKWTNPDTDDTYSYFVYVYKTGDAFWAMQFAVLDKNAEKYAPQIAQWAKSVTFTK